MKTIDDYTIRDIRALINDRDALVAMNAELVEALEELSGIVQGVIDESEPLNIKDHVDSLTLQPSINALLKAKELSHGKG
tara:strand:- start:549 stop:788 length:240 start_codon:yes stop_codon:yes gene_type:complete